MLFRSVATGCYNMDCSGFVRADGALVAPGDVIKPVSDVPDGPVQNITLRLLKVTLASFLLFISPSF